VASQRRQTPRWTANPDIHAGRRLRQGVSTTVMQVRRYAIFTTRKRKRCPREHRMSQHTYGVACAAPGLRGCLAQTPAVPRRFFTFRRPYSFQRSATPFAARRAMAALPLRCSAPRPPLFVRRRRRVAAVRRLSDTAARFVTRGKPQCATGNMPPLATQTVCRAAQRCSPYLRTAWMDARVEAEKEAGV